LIDHDAVFCEAINAATEIIQTSSSINTSTAFQGDLKYWNHWYQANFISMENVRKEHIILFVLQHAENMPSHIDDDLVERGIKSKRGLHKMSTIRRRIRSLSTYLKLKKLPNPCQDKDISILISKLTKKHGSSHAWGKAITLDILNDLIHTCQNDGLIGIRDSALLLFGFSTGGRRRTEISSAMLENLTRSSDGNFIYNLGKSKTNQEGKYDPKPLAGRAAIALMHWINEAGIKEGPIFRGVAKGGRILSTALCDKQVSRIIKNRCKKAGHDPSQYTAHSLRSGFVTEGGKRGKPIGDIMAMTGHKSVDQVMHYYQTGAVFNNSAAYLAG
jgi:integrase